MCIRPGYCAASGRTRRSCQSGAQGSRLSQPSFHSQRLGIHAWLSSRRRAGEQPEQRRARYLVVVDPEDPVTRAERGEPCERPLDGLRVGVANEGVGELRHPAETVERLAFVPGDHELVGDRPEQLE